MRAWFRDRARIAFSLLFILPLAAIVRPILWVPLDHRSYNYFHSKRPVTPWDDVAVVGIDERTMKTVFERPIYPLSRHEEAHALLTRRLDEAGARIIAFDLTLDADSFDHSPSILAEAFSHSGKVCLVAGMENKTIHTPTGSIHVLESTQPDSLLVRASQGAYFADVRIDADGTLRRFSPLDPSGRKSLPEHLAGRSVDRPIPILFPSIEQPIPVLSYADILTGDTAALRSVQDKIVLIGAVEPGSADEVVVPRRQDLGGGRTGYRLPGCLALGAITQTILQGAPLRDAGSLTTLAWSLGWCLALIALLPKENPLLAVVVFLGVLGAAIAATGWVHVAGSLVLPAGSLFGTLFLTGAFTLISSHLDTSREFHREEAENERIQKELRLARETQERLLPTTLPSVEQIDVWGKNLSSLEVSGDYYDVLDPGENGPLLLGIADVSGKGLPAAMLMSVVQAGLHTLLLQGKLAVAPAMETLNRLVCGNVTPGRFVTMFLADVDKDTSSMRYVRAGHDPPLHIKRNGEVQKLEEPATFFLGFSPDTAYETGSVQLSAEDVVCLYTDGITEAMDRDESFFGEERLRQVLIDHRGLCTAEIGAAVLKAVKEHSQGMPQADDITLLILKVKSGAVQKLARVVASHPMA